MVRLSALAKGSEPVSNAELIEQLDRRRKVETFSMKWPEFAASLLWKARKAVVTLEKGIMR
jgi:hypothetical protein